jgi:hypothetical protein
LCLYALAQKAQEPVSFRFCDVLTKELVYVSKLHKATTDIYILVNQHYVPHRPSPQLQIMPVYLLCGDQFTAFKWNHFTIYRFVMMVF